MYCNQPLVWKVRKKKRERTTVNQCHKIAYIDYIDQLITYFISRKKTK